MHLSHRVRLPERSLAQRVASALAVCLVASAAWASSALADATPVQLVLVYMPTVSTSGSTSASGVAEVLLPEGEVRIKAADMIHLDGDQRYVAWVVNTTTNEFLRLGAFNAAASTGAVRYENVLPDAIPNHGWNLLLVTVEANDRADHPSTEHSIAGLFPRGETAPLPSVLPNTGGLPDGAVVVAPAESHWPGGSGLAALTLVAGFGAGYVARSRVGSPSHTSFQGTRVTRR